MGKIILGIPACAKVLWWKETDSYKEESGMDEIWLEAGPSMKGFKGFVKDFGLFSKSKRR